MNEFVQGPLGAIHTLSAVMALIVGATVFTQKKGTSLHRKLGYIYFVCMLVLNISAIPITNMTGSVGLFHVFIVLSLPTILAALYFPLFGRSKESWMRRHFEFMYWSYVGLIAAFIAEVLVRLPLLLTTDRELADSNLEAIGGIVSAVVIMAITMGIAEYVFRKLKKRMFNKPEG